MFKRVDIIVSLLCVLLPALLLAPRPSASAATVVSPSGWGWQNPLPQAEDLHGVWGSSSADVFVVGDSGVILHYDGTGWVSMDSGTTAYLCGIWGSSSADVFVVGDSGVILRYSGTGWVSMDSGTTAYLCGIWGSSSSDVFAVGTSGTILHYDGTVWSSMSSGTTNYLNGVWGNSGSDVYAVGWDGGIYHYGGSSWSCIAPSRGGVAALNAVWAGSSSNVFAVGESGCILHYDGTSWNTITCSASSDNQLHLGAVCGVSPSDVFAVGDGYSVLRYDGTGWKRIRGQSAELNLSLEAVWASSPTDVFAVGWDELYLVASVIYHYNGTTWSMTAPGTKWELYGVWGSSPSDVWVVGADNYHYDGVAWTPADITHSPLKAIWGSSSADVFVVGDSGVILHYDGTGWVSMDNGTTASLHGIWGSSSSDVFAVGSSGTILHYDGTVWSAMSSGTTNYLNGVWGNSGSDVYAVGTSGIILHYDGSAWTQIPSATSQALQSVWCDPALGVFVVSWKGGILHYPESTAPPSITSIEPSLGGKGHTMSVVICGSNLTRVSEVAFGSGISVDSFHIDSDTLMTANITVQSDTPIGPRDVWVTTVDGIGMQTGGFEVLGAPTITSIDPSVGVQGQSVSITITGTYLAGATSLDFGSGIDIDDFTVESTTEITANIRITATASVGATDVTIVAPGGVATTTGAFTVEDGSSPSVPLVADDGAATTSTSQLHATWSSSDADSGVGEYQYAIGTSSGATDVVDWTSTGTEAEVGHSGLSLTRGTTYFFSVKAKNGAGLWSDKGVSDGIAVRAAGGLPFWVWTIVGLAAVSLAGVGAYLIGRRRRAKP